MRRSHSGSDADRSSLRVMPLGGSLEPVFWEYVNRDIPDYYFFIVDMKRGRESSRVWLALDEQSHIEGLMLVYGDRIVQLRGNAEATTLLLEKLNLEKVEIQGPPTQKDLALSRFRKVHKATEIILMTLTKEDESLQMKHQPVRLTVDDAEDIAALMRQGNPEWWGETTAERVAGRMDQRLWLGVKVDGKLVSVGGAIIDSLGSNIATVVTHEEYRNRGYATSIVSSLVREILQKSDLSLIHVESSNKPALRVYTKVGFKPYKRYFLARAEK